MSKPKLATVWLEGCSGCHMSFLDLDENLALILDAVELTYCPITDFKDYEFPEVDVGVVEGAVANREQLEIVHKLRDKCKILVVWGDCAVFGGINLMRNRFSVKELLAGGYPEAGSPDNGNSLPAHEDLPALLDKVVAVNEVVAVDVYVPGCPPSTDSIAYALEEILAGRLPKLPSGLLHFD